LINFAKEHRLGGLKKNKTERRGEMSKVFEVLEGGGGNKKATACRNVRTCLGDRRGGRLWEPNWKNGPLHSIYST